MAAPAPTDGYLTRGQGDAIAAARSLVSGGPPHAILLVGPGSSGKTTLALDIAADLLCSADSPGRPCRTCRSCRLVVSGRHPDIHLLSPGGAGRQIAIGEPKAPEPGTVRHLVGEIALTSVEGGARVAIVEEAHRMNEDAQNALLKTLEEPPPGVTIILCADDEERLLPTVRSRCARIRLGPVGPRDIEALLTERGVADPPTSARLARIAGGRPGLALAYASAPEAVSARQEIGRVLLDLLAAGRAVRLARVRALLARSADLIAALAAPPTEPVTTPTGRARRSGRRASRPTDAIAGASDGAADPAPAADPAADAAGLLASSSGPERTSERTSEPDPARDEGASAPAARASAAERRRAALALLDVWRDVARDLVVTARGGRGHLRDPGFLDELDAVAGRLDPVAGAAFLARLERTAGLVEGNANPELAVDVLVLGWSADALGS